MRRGFMAGRNEGLRTVLVAVVAGLLGIGAVMIYSTTARGDGPLVSGTFLRQMLYLTLGVLCAVLVGRLDYHVILKRHGHILLAAAALLVVVLVPGIGRRVNGARRWLRVGGIGVQPSEIAKIALVVFLSAFLAKRAGQIRSFAKTFLPAMAVTGVICVLILGEPDIGTCFLLGLVSVVVLFAAGARIPHLLLPAAAAAPVLALVVSRGYARERIMVWLDPWKDPYGAGYHIVQSLIAIGSGGMSGVGLGASKQKLLFLPEAQTDFIFAILAEEMGFVGVTIVLALYVTFAWCGIAIARRARDMEGMLLATGITSLVSFQAITNIAVVTRVFPTKGIALPFISAGGSSIVMMLAGVALLYSVACGAGQPQIQKQAA